MDNRVVGISDMLVSNVEGEVLVTYSLGSCVGLALYDPEVKVGGLIHCMLPLSKIDEQKARTTPAMFVDTGVPKLLQTLFDMGASRKRVIAKVAGASSLLDEKGLFRIGERNYTVLRKILWKNDILIAAEDVRGTKSRSMYLHIGTGKIIIRSGGVETEL